MSDTIKVGRIAPHEWEEPCISGSSGSGAIFFAGCNMGCVFCQNEQLSKGMVGREYSIDELVTKALELQAMGCHNLNLVTPTHYIPQIVDFLRRAKGKGLQIPVVYNTSGYELVESLKLLEGLVDVYLPDFKYIKNKSSAKYSNAKDYPEIAKAALKEMVRQVGRVKLNEETGLIEKGVIVRHLVLPSYIEESKEIIKYLYNEYGDEIFISIMNQFTPFARVAEFPELNRRITKKEYDEVIDFAIELGIEQGYIQEGETAMESFIPSFES